jgi:hypothetical protein
MLSAAVHRRHLDKSVRAALAVEIEVLAGEEKAAEERRRAGGKKGGETAARGRPKSADRDVETVPQPKARDRAGKTVGTSGRYVGAAKSLRAKSPALFEKVMTGELSLPQATAEARRDAKRAEAKAKAAAAAGKPRTGPKWELITGDCVREMHRMPVRSVDLFTPDPPYNQRVMYDGYRDDRTTADYERWCETWVGLCVDLLADDGGVGLRGRLPTAWDRRAADIQRDGDQQQADLQAVSATTGGSAGRTWPPARWSSTAVLACMRPCREHQRGAGYLRGVAAVGEANRTRFGPGGSRVSGLSRRGSNSKTRHGGRAHGDSSSYFSRYCHERAAHSPVESWRNSPRSSRSWPV